ncbi:siderophore-interacting protein [Rhizobiaceae bacterium BDR2-2]|uniref:Siderophore-interacting protein n=1 Tax=Ectorhizobium quercum TaxID=2965071 RepID=A0AAE3MVW2_9HYPH|nr:siderophore-interacting protein [Ectorhizobium quercum]MCX8995839.1 siderophore-interacting protein [Ectorhizobium quercum]
MNDDEVDVLADDAVFRRGLPHVANATIMPGDDASLVLARLHAHLRQHDVSVRKLNDTLFVEMPDLSAALRLSDSNISVEITAVDTDTLYFSKLWLEDAVSGACDGEGRIEWGENCRSSVLPPGLLVLTVAGVEDLSPKNRRITFRTSHAASFDRADRIHLRLMLNFQEVTASVIRSDANGEPRADHPKPLWRTYTISSVDSVAGTINVEFLLHGANGPGADWARQAKPLDRVGATGPIGKALRPARSYLLAGDETALPAIRRLIASLDETVTVKLVVEVATQQDTIPMESKAMIETRWLYRGKQGSASILPDVLRTMEIPAASSRRFVWAACEADAAKRIRSVLSDRGVKPEEQLVAAYWHR